MLEKRRVMEVKGHLYLPITGTFKELCAPGHHSSFSTETNIPV